MLAELGALLGEALVLQDAERALALGNTHVRRRHQLAAALRGAHHARAANSHEDGVCLHTGMQISAALGTVDAQRARDVNCGFAGRTSGFSHVCAQVRAAIVRECVTTRVGTGGTRVALYRQTAKAPPLASVARSALACTECWQERACVRFTCLYARCYRAWQSAEPRCVLGSLGCAGVAFRRRAPPTAGQDRASKRPPD